MPRATTRRCLCILAAAAVAAPAPAAPSEPGIAAERLADGWETLLARIVRSGNVDYTMLARDRAELDRLTGALEAIDPAGLPTEEDRAAFWINAYNLLVVGAVLDGYPIRSPRAIGGFFDRKQHRVAGRRLTLDEIEDDLTGDPRYHFALVCAASSCPPLIPRAYRGDRLDEQLEERARAVIQDDAFVRVDVERGKIVASRIFDWYRGEFEAPGSLLEYWNRYRAAPLPAGFDLEFAPYDWTLNDTALTEHPERRLRFTPSSLLVPGETEVQVFNNLYTQTAFYDSEGNEQEQAARSSYLTINVSLRRGWRHRINGGLDVFFRAVKDENFRPEGNPSFQGDSRAALTSVVPNVQFAPVASLPTLSIESGFLIPLASDLDGDSGRRPFLAFGDLAWLNEVFYDVRLGRRFLLFWRAGAFLRFDSESAQLTTPLTAILDVFPTPAWTLYGLAEVAPDWLGDSRGTYYSQMGLGAKVRPRPWYEIEILFTTFPAGESSGAGQTYNLGFRFMR